MKNLRESVFLGIMLGLVFYFFNLQDANASWLASWFSKNNSVEKNEGPFPSKLIPEYLLKLSEVVNVENSRYASGSNIAVEDENHYVIITIRNILLTPMNMGDTKSKNLFDAEKIEIFSDTPGRIVETQVVDGQVSIRIPNIAKITGHAFVVHLWGRGTGADGDGWLVLHVSDPWVTYRNFFMSDLPNLDTLAIGLVMYPDKTTEPLRFLG